MSKQLQVMEVPLDGRHLIEASAGTGKTFNITRLYLRLLLEQELTVQQILVMTYTKAATEEIRGRLASTLREAQRFWVDSAAAQGVVQADPVYSELYERIDPERALTLLSAALLELDEAAVHTIHGFCQQVMGQLAFSSGVSMSVNLQTDTVQMYTLACQDFIRQCAQHDSDYDNLMQQGWHDPDVFLSTFASAIYTDLTPRIMTPEQVEQEATEQLNTLQTQMAPMFDEALDCIERDKAFLFSVLIDDKKPAERAKRQAEWEVMVQWLADKELVLAPIEVGEFVKGQRYPKKADIKAALMPVITLRNNIKERLENIAKASAKGIEKSPAFEVVARGIHFIREHVTQQKKMQSVVDFNDLISRLAQAIEHTDDRVCQQLRQLYPAALVDEFQDTDAQQYHILSHVYQPRAKEHVLMMIGDPKQAIYGFRGGDIFTYLKAASQADYRWVMDTNWRSVQSMVTAYNRLFYGAPLTSEANDVFGFDIRYEPVNYSPHAKAVKTPLVDSDEQFRAMNYVWLESDESKVAKGQLQQQICQWISQEVSRLLVQAKLGENSVKPADIAILVRKGKEAQLIKQTLAKAGISAVYLSNRSSLFVSEEARDLLRVLYAVWYWDQPGKVHGALGSPLLGIEQKTLMNLLYHDNEQAWELMLERFNMLKQHWLQRGCLSMILFLLQEYYQPNSAQTERALTNYQHLAEVLENVAARQPHPAQTVLWLHRQVTSPELAQEQVQRLESDDQLIQIVTQHGAKGLEYPIVFIPFGNDYQDPTKWGKQTTEICKYYSEEMGGQQLLLGQCDSVLARVKAEGDAEQMRLLYVAVTRASHRCYIGLASFEQSTQSPLARALDIHHEESWRDQLTQLTQDNSETTALISVSNVAHDTQVSSSVAAPDISLALATFTGNIDDTWRLYSFSALTRQQAVVRHTQREGEIELVDEPSDTRQVEDNADDLRFTLAKGASAGNLLHDILEVTDFCAPDWDQVADIVERHGMDSQINSGLTLWLQEVLDTPLTNNNTTQAFTLSMLTMGQTLREPEFYFPLAHCDLYQLSRFLQRHRQQESELLGINWPVPTLTGNKIEGMMHGFIDLIFCHDGKYYVADYKSTHLGGSGGDYDIAALTSNNQHHLYDLQYLIYSVALHRYLRDRLVDYDPEHHFGGVYYFYLRGMSATFAQQSGVYFYPLPIASVLELEAILTADTDQ